MKSWELLRVVFKQTGCKRVAQELQLSLSLVTKWQEPPKPASGQLNPLDRLLALIRLVGNLRLLQWLAEQFECDVVPRAKRRPAPPATELLPATCAMTQRVGRLLVAMNAVPKHRRRSPAETESVRQLWTELKPEMEAYLAEGRGLSLLLLGLPLLWTESLAESALAFGV